MFGILEAAAVPHSGIFNTYEDLMFDLNRRMESEGYKIVKARSHRNKIGGGDVAGNEIVRCDLVCDRGGRPYKSTATKHKTHTKKTGCPWKAKAVNRKSVGGWVLTVFCNEHNHEAGTPEPPSIPEACEEDGTDADNEDEVHAGPRPDPETLAALRVAGVSDSTLRLNGDTFHHLKTDYRKMTQGDRLNALAQLQLRIAALYAVQNEDMQRQKRQETQHQRHRAVDASRNTLSVHKHRARRHPRTRDEQHQQASNLPAEPELSLTEDLVHIGPNRTSDALMQGPHFQLTDPASAMDSVEITQYHEPSKRMRPYRPQGT
ncbi:hypothetical protein MAC_04537 [Metarhizium acridum CQMa 102]|uniref:FAR1 domain-containing protein n=1 Tax=Metarhizium acridum (strain CQMa 102) TaxID=655827 RepID=E9E3T9_METAQ|nr:uncharacterized protein MAC_04537 [Metarhizium acridum CQMa 102]EFY89351.1 hypothetical protein MAC_04537 [Metarhizium acridum CQMa 102]